jgi:hypothetical protein
MFILDTGDLTNANADYQAYLQWLDEGNEPLPSTDLENA